MIVLFHCFANIFYFHWFKKYFTNKKEPAKEETSSSSSTEIFKYVPPTHEDTALRCKERGIYFDPPLAKQRYARVTDILIHEKWRQSVRKIVEFGCASFQLFPFFKNTLQMQKLYFVDIDEMLLRESYQKLHPLGADFLSRRTQPLTIKVFCGSVTEPDPRLLNTDVVVAIELIEHLYPDVLEAVPYNIFFYVNPRVVIITTPNSDFNPLFNNPERKFRHTDHKFEWSREQFQEWAANICTRFPNYTVHFDGIGLDPEATYTYGCCSQLALFVKNDDVPTSCDKISNSITSSSSPNRDLSENQDFATSSVAVGLRCRCTDSPAKACRNLDETQSLRLCLCPCRGCTPRNSYGICTYNSYVARNSYGCDFSPKKGQENGLEENCAENVQDFVDGAELIVPTSSHSYCDFSYKNQNSHQEDDQSDDNSSIEMSVGPRQHHDRLYYKPIATIKYPFDVDTRTLEQKTLDEIRYRLRSFANVYSSFYDGELNCARVPIDKLICGKEGNYITESEMRAILLKHNFQIEECLIPETDQTETCVIYVPPDDDMELSSSGGENDTSSAAAASSTEASAGYESDNNVYAASEEECGWDEVDGLPEKLKEVSDVEPDEVEKRSQTPPQQPAADSSLMDSGYQKSPLNEEPPPPPAQAVSIAPPPVKNYFEMFKDAPNEQNLPPTNNQQQSKSNRLSTILSVFEPFTPEKMNELDAIRKEKKFLNFANMAHKDAMKKLCQEIKHPVAGPSNVFKKKQIGSSDKKISCPAATATSPLAPLIPTSINAAAAASLENESEADYPVEDAKSIANCILENSLNKIELNDDDDKAEEENGGAILIQNLERVQQQDELLIEDAAAAAAFAVPVNVAGGAGQIPAAPVALPVVLGPLQLLEAVAVVENGDLANNNRDGEGNNYPPDEQPAHIEQFDPNNLPVDPPRPAAPQLHNNIDNHNALNNMNVHNNNNQLILLMEDAVAGQQQQQQHGEDILVLRHEPQGGGEEEEEEEHMMLLHPPEFQLQAAPVCAGVDGVADAADHGEMALSLQQGIHHLPPVLGVMEAAEPPEVVAWSSREALYDSNSQVDLLEDFDMDQVAVHLDEALALAAAPNFVVVAGNLNDEAVPMLPDESSFPHWLLQIFEEEEPAAGDDDINLHDEPHFYCQGDGLGVHPSTVNLNNEDGDDEAETDEESDSSVSGSADLAGQNLDGNEIPGAVARLPQNVADFGEENNGVLAAVVLPNDEAHSLDALVDLAVVGQAIVENNRQEVQPEPPLEPQQARSVSSEQEEFFESAEELDSALPTATDSSKL